MYMDPCVETEHKTRVGSVKDEKAAGEQDFAWRRYCNWLICHDVRITAIEDDYMPFAKEPEGRLKL